MHNTALLVFLLGALVAYCDACTNGVSGGSGCLCYDGYSYSSGGCAAISALSSCPRVAPNGTVSPPAPTLGGGVSGNDFMIIVNFQTLETTRYVQSITYTNGGSPSTGYEYPSSSSWAVTGVSSSCTQVYNATFGSTAGENAGVYVIDKSAGTSWKYSGDVWITTSETVTDSTGNTEQRVITYHLQYAYVFPVSSASMSASASVVSDLDVTTEVEVITLQALQTDGTISIGFTVGTKYPYQLDWASHILNGQGAPDFPSLTDITVPTSLSGVTATSGASPPDCSNSQTSLCDEAFTFTINPGSACNVDGLYVITLAATKCIGDTTTTCLDNGSGGKVLKRVTISFALALGALCQASTTFSVQPGAQLTINSDAARTITKTRYVEGVDTTLYFSTMFQKTANSPGTVSTVVLQQVEVQCMTAFCTTAQQTLTDITEAVTAETNAPIAHLYFNIPLTEFLVSSATSTTSDQFQWNIQATALVLFSTGSKRSVTHTFSLSPRSSGSSASGYADGEFYTAKADEQTGVTSSPAGGNSAVVVTQAPSSGLGLGGLIGVIVGAVCFAGFTAMAAFFVVKYMQGRNVAQAVPNSPTPSPNNI